MADFSDNFGEGGRGVGDGARELRRILGQAQEEYLNTDMVDLVAFSSVQQRLRAPFRCTVTEVMFRTDDAPSSAGGTVVATVATGGTNLLAAATFNLETQVNGTNATPALTATLADRNLEKGDPIEVEYTSDNADMLNGAGQTCMITVQRRA